MMPSKKKKYNARFPPGRIKKIMQTDEEVGKVAQAVPVIISRALEMFVESLLTKTMEITSARNAKTLSPSHMKHCIFSESRFDFLKDLVKSLPDMAGEGEECLNSAAPGRPAVVGNEVSSHAVTEEYSAQDDVDDNAVVNPTNPVLRVGECHKTYGSIPHPNMNNSPNCESEVTSKLNKFAETGTEGISLPKNTVIKFYPVAEPSGGTVLSMDTSKTSGIAFGNAVDISGVLPITQTIPSFKEQLQPQTSSIALDEDYDD